MIQIIVTIFVIFALSRNYIQFKSNSSSIWQFIFWIIIWVGVLGISYWPNLTDKLAVKLGIARGIDVFVYLGIVGLFYLIFRAYIKLEELEREITRLVRAMSLKEIEDKENDKLS